MGILSKNVDVSHSISYEKFVHFPDFCYVKLSVDINQKWFKHISEFFCLFFISVLFG